MAEEPQSRIEGPLRRLATERRAAAGGEFELSWTMRRRFQLEVRRAFGQTGRRSVSTWWLALWPRFALAVVLLGFLGFATVYWFPEARLARSGRQLASRGVPPVSELQARPSPFAVERRGEAKPPEGRVEADGPAVGAVRLNEAATASLGIQPQPPTPSAAPTKTSTEGEARLESAGLPREAFALRESAGTLDAAPPANAPAGGAGGAVSPPASTSGPAPSAAALTALAASPPPTAPPNSTRDESALAARGVAAESLRSRSSAGPNTASLRAAPGRATVPDVLNFARVESAARRRNFNSPALPPVLRAFRVESTGAQLRLVDTDGSVYTGALESAPEARRGPSASGARSFQVSGASQTLDQPVVVTGELFPPAKSTASGVLTRPPEAVGAAGWMIRGRVSVGRRTDFSLEAVATP